MTTPFRILEIYQEACTYSGAHLSSKEFAFIQSIYRASLQQGFAGLSVKQEAWFTAIANKLEAAKGKLAFQIIGEKHRYKFEQHRKSYRSACVGY
jgi:hypothetical protein